MELPDERNDTDDNSKTIALKPQKTIAHIEEGTPKAQPTPNFATEEGTPLIKKDQLTEEDDAQV